MKNERKGEMINNMPNNKKDMDRGLCEEDGGDLQNKG